MLTPTEELRRILISRTDGLGDVIVTLPIAVALKERLPDAEVAFLVTPYTAPIVRRIAEVNQVLTLTTMRRGLHLMRIYKPDAIIFARPDPKLALEAVLARIDVRIGTGYRYYSGLFTRWVYEHRRKGAKHEAQYGVNLLSPLLAGELPVRMPKLAISPQGDAEAKRSLAGAGVVGEYMVIHPGSRGSASVYTAAGYAEVATALLSERHDLSMVITAGSGEESLAAEVLSGIQSPGRAVVLAGLSLDGLSELLRGATGFLGSSSGPAHLAALVETPVVGLYPGLPPVWPARWRPLGEHCTTLVPHPDEPLCATCGRGHEPENCVSRIAPARVIEACRGMLVGRDLGTGDYIS
ncbi:MAG: glycosyltransferase family 9 protein [Candidatus Kapaibacterium sp.]